MPACPSCLSLFPNVKSLRTHRKNVHGLKCPDCKEVFVDKASVAQHYGRKHRDGRGYRCLWCNTRFEGASVLDAHIASTHYTTRATNVEDVSVPSENRTSEGAPPNGLVALPWVGDPARGRGPNTDRVSSPDETRSAGSQHPGGTTHTSPADEERSLTRTASIAESDEMWTDVDSGSIDNADNDGEDALHEDQTGPESVLAVSVGDIANSEQPSRAPSVVSDSAVSDATAPATTRDATPPSTPGPIPVRNQTSAGASRSTSEEPRASPADFACKICSRMPADPTVTVCGHLFCHSCIMEELAKRLCCPTCQKIMFVRINT